MLLSRYDCQLEVEASSERAERTVEMLLTNCAELTDTEKGTVAPAVNVAFKIDTES